MKRKTIYKFSTVLLLFIRVCAFAQYAAPQKISINEGWEFSKSENSLNWEIVHLPHTWNAKDVVDEIPGYYKGIGWYKKNLQIPVDFKNKKIFIEFEGANINTEVFINDQSVGKHKGGYTSFRFEITPFLKKEGQNFIKVKVDNAEDLNNLPITADFTFYGGIYRDVFLIIKNDVHFDMMNQGSAGVFIKTPSVSAKKGEVEISAKISNSASQTKKIKLLTEVKDKEGKTVFVKTQNGNIQKNSSFNFDINNITVENPQLWSPDHPYLYNVNLKIIDSQSGEIIDYYNHSLGFRWFKFDPEKGFYLNGNYLKLIGTNRHQDRAGYGNALPDDFHEEDICLIKNMGSNFIRIAHYPQDPSFLNLCDKYGLLVWEEIPVVNEINTTVEFANHAKLTLKEMIRQNFNHPSIIIWGYMNEIFATRKMRKLVERKELLQKTTELAQELELLAKSEDSSRSTAMALEYTFADEYYQTGIGNVCDVIGWNLYLGWYQEDMTQFGPFLDKWHEKYPGKNFIISEFGAGSDIRIHSLNPVKYDYSIEYQEKILASYYSQILERPYVAGASVWNSFDFNSEGRMDVVPNINNKGLLTVDRKPKDSYFFFQANLLKEPFIKIASVTWDKRTGRAESETENSSIQPVIVHSNLEKAELFLNGKTLGSKKFVGRTAIWDVPFIDGKNKLLVHSLTEEKHSDQLDINFQLQPYLLSSPSFKSIAVNLGSHEFFTEEPVGTCWEPEQKYTKGYWGYIKKQDDIYQQPVRFDVKETTSDPLFYSFNEGADSIRFDLADGEYEVELLTVSGLANRDFDVLVNNQKIYDYQSLKQEKSATRIKTYILVKDNQGMTVSFNKIKGKPILSGVKIKKM